MDHSVCYMCWSTKKAENSPGHGHLCPDQWSTGRAPAAVCVRCQQVWNSCESQPWQGCLPAELAGRDPSLHACMLKLAPAAVPETTTVVTYLKCTDLLHIRDSFTIQKNTWVSEVNSFGVNFSRNGARNHNPRNCIDWLSHTPSDTK